MLDLSDTEPEFRDELRQWLREHLVGEFAEHRGVGSPTDEQAWDVRLRWERELSAGNWLGLSWPREYGGRGLGLNHEIIFEIEYALADAPARVNFQGVDLFGPTLARWGSPELRARFLPRILAVEDIWGQGFSEPGAGSDLAAIKTKATLEDDEWVIDGQKVWTTFGHRANWLYLLARTEPGSQRHKGLSMLLIEADAPGVEVRPIRNLAGQGEFSEVFLSGARTPRDLVVGEPGQGWAVAMSLLGVERGKTLLPMQMGFERELRRAAAAATASGTADDPLVRAKLGQSFAEIRTLRATVLRAIEPVLAGGDPGPEAMTTKLFASSAHQRLAELAVDVQGAAGLLVGDELTDEQRTWQLSRAESIYGGTSQIQRNMIAERVLGLPREPR